MRKINVNFQLAFSLMEMMVVLLIVAIIAAATAPMVSRKMMRNAGTGDSPWVFTGLSGNIAYNLNGRNDTIIIGASKYNNDGKGPKHPRLFINSDNNADHAAIVFGRDGKYTSQLQLGDTTAIWGDAQLGNCSTAVGMGQTQDGSIGYATLFGYDARTKKDSGSGAATAIGKSACALASYSVALGVDSQAENQGAIAIGGGSWAQGQQSIAIGNGSPWKDNDPSKGRVSDGTTYAGGQNAIAVGILAHAFSQNSIAIGNSAHANGEADDKGAPASTAVGYCATASTAWSTAIGGGSNATGHGGTAIGAGALAKGYQSIAIGQGDSNIEGIKANSEGKVLGVGNPRATGPYSIAIGAGAIATAENSVAIGTDVVNDMAGKIMLGGPGHCVFIPGDLIVGGNVLLGERPGSSTFIRESKGAITQTFLTISRMETNNHGVLIGSVEGDSEANGKTCLSSGYTYPSDRRLKNVGEKYTAGLDELKKLEFFNYTFKKDENKTPRVGVMAQDLQKVFPDAVTKGDDGYLRIRLEDMFYAVINAVKELDAKIAKIITDVSGLSSKVDEQQKVIDEQAQKIEALEKQNLELMDEIKNIEKQIKKIK